MPLYAEQVSEGFSRLCLSSFMTFHPSAGAESRRITRRSRIRLLLLFCSAVIIATVHAPLFAQDAAPSVATSPKTCLVPKPDWAELHDTPAGAKHVAKAAKDTSDTIRVAVSKPLPKCVTVSAKIDAAKPVLTDNGMLASDKDVAPGTVVGSANCLLAGLINADFTDCSPAVNTVTTDRQKTAVLRENLPLDFVILNIVRWSVFQKRPAKHSDWYLYDRHTKDWRSWKVSDSLRILGSANVGFLAVHFGIDDTCGISYSVKAKAGTAQNIADLQQLYSAIATVAGGKLPGLPGSGSQTKQTGEKQVVNSTNVTLSSANQIVGLADMAIVNPTEEMKAEIAERGIDLTDKAALRAQIESSPDSLLTKDLASITLSSKLDVSKFVARDALKSTVNVDPGVGVYGFATFRGLEKLPYDLTLSGTPSGTPRVYGEKEAARVASIIATVEARPVIPSNASHLSLQVRTVKDDDGHAIGWSIADAPISCAAAPKSPVQADESNASAVDQSKNDGQRRDASIALQPKVAMSAPHLVLADWRAPEEGRGSFLQSAQKDKTKKPTDPTGSDNASGSKAADPYKSEQTYHNEGLYRWDVSLGVPVLTPKKTVYAATDGTVRKSSTSPVNVYAFFDFFPKKTDLTKFPKINVPTLSAGLPLASQPFNRPVFGSSLGLNFFGLRISPFAGVVLLRELRPSTLALGSTATASQLKSDLTSHRNVRLFISVNFSLKDAASLVKSATKSTASSGSKSNGQATSTPASGSSGN